MEKHELEFKDGWLVWVFLVGIPCFFVLTLGATPSSHGAFIRETSALAVMLSFVFTVLAGFARPAGWLAFFGIMAACYLLPHIRATNLQLYFVIANYFTLFYSLGDRLTLGKMFKLAGFSAMLMGFAYFVDPGVEPGDFGQGVLGWFSLSVLLVLVNAFLRLGKSGASRSRLAWRDET